MIEYIEGRLLTDTFTPVIGRKVTEGHETLKPSMKLNYDYCVWTVTTVNTIQ
jgi:hypothetical protein